MESYQPVKVKNKVLLAGGAKSATTFDVLKRLELCIKIMSYFGDLEQSYSLFLKLNHQIRELVKTNELIISKFYQVGHK